MKLYFSKFSPFARKVLLTAYITDQIKKIEIVDLGQSGAFKPGPEYFQTNPLLKVPALQINPQESLIDSPIICEYLNSLSPRDKIYPSNTKDYFFQRKIESIADGVADAVVLRRMESLRPANLFSADYDNSQKLKIENGLNYLESICDRLNQRYMIGEIAVMCLLGYLDLRFPQENWRSSRPHLTQWFLECQNWEPFKNTKIN